MMKRREPGSADRANEWLCAGIMLVLGLALGLDGSGLAGPIGIEVRRGGASPGVWAAWLGAAGSARLAALHINGRWPKTPIIRMVGAGFGLFAWSQLAVLVEEGSARATGVPTAAIVTYAMLALAELSSIYKAAHDARYHHV